MVKITIVNSGNLIFTSTYRPQKIMSTTANIKLYNIHTTLYVRVTRSLDLCIMFCRLLFVLLLLAIVLSFRFTDSDYPFGIFKPFLIFSNKTINTCPLHRWYNAKVHPRCSASLIFSHKMSGHTLMFSSFFRPIVTLKLFHLFNVCLFDGV